MGSSRRRTDASVRSRRAICARCFCPPESSPTGRSHSAPRKSDAFQHAVDARVGLVAARALEALALLVVLVQEVLELVGVSCRAVGRDRLLEAAHRALELEERLLRPRDEGAERLVPFRLDRLVERRERRPAREVALPAVGLERAPGRSSGRWTCRPRCGPRDPRSGRDRAATWRPRGRPSSRSSCGRFRGGTAPRGG